MSIERFSCMSAGSKVSGSAYARQLKTSPAGMAAGVAVASALGASVLVGWASGALVGSTGAAVGGTGVAVGSVPPQAAIMGISSTKSTNAISFLENILSIPPKVSLKLCAPAFEARVALRDCFLNYL